VTQGIIKLRQPEVSQKGWWKAASKIARPLQTDDKLDVFGSRLGKEKIRAVQLHSTLQSRVT
jgi:hypothetical protein